MTTTHDHLARTHEPPPLDEGTVRVRGDATALSHLGWFVLAMAAVAGLTIGQDTLVTQIMRGLAALVLTLGCGLGLLRGQALRAAWCALGVAMATTLLLRM